MGGTPMSRMAGTAMPRLNRGRGLGGGGVEPFLPFRAVAVQAFKERLLVRESFFTRTVAAHIDHLLDCLLGRPILNDYPIGAHHETGAIPAFRAVNQHRPGSRGGDAEELLDLVVQRHQAGHRNINELHSVALAELQLTFELVFVLAVDAEVDDSRYVKIENTLTADIHRLAGTIQDTAHDRVESLLAIEMVIIHAQAGGNGRDQDKQ